MKCDTLAALALQLTWSDLRMDVARGFQAVVTTSEVFQSYEERETMQVLLEPRFFASNGFGKKRHRVSQEDYHELLQRLRTLAAVVEGNAPVEERSAAGLEMIECHERAQQAFQQMDFEVKSMGPLGAALSGKLQLEVHWIKGKLCGKILQCKERIQAGDASLQERAICKDPLGSLFSVCRTLVRNIQARLQREGLLSGMTQDEEKAERDSSNRLRAGARRLEDSRRTALEAEASNWQWEPCDDVGLPVTFKQLWFAVRGGGGGTYGIVTSVYYQLHEQVNQQLEMDYHAGGLAVGRDSIFHNEGSDRSGGSRKDDVEEERAKVQGQGFHTAAHMVEAPDDDEGFEKVADAPEKRKKEEEKASS
eukprot:g20583.t1